MYMYFSDGGTMQLRATATTKSWQGEMKGKYANAGKIGGGNVNHYVEKIYKEIIGDYYSPSKITNVLKEIDKLVAENNLQFVEHEVIETITNDEINLKFNIREGQKVLVERINIKGNNVTNESVIRSELLLDEGDPFTDLNLDKSIAKLKSRNIFSKLLLIGVPYVQ